jgi:hypothetical protein
MLRFLAAFALIATPAIAGALPTKVGHCTKTKIKSIGPRLEGADFSSGVYVKFVNGGYQVSYDPVRAIIRSKPRDRVRMCLVSIPEGCPPGDERGKIYRTKNLRAGKSWELPDAQHFCGGA